VNEYEIQTQNIRYNEKKKRRQTSKSESNHNSCYQL